MNSFLHGLRALRRGSLIESGPDDETQGAKTLRRMGITANTFGTLQQRSNVWLCEPDEIALRATTEVAEHGVNSAVIACLHSSSQDSKIKIGFPKFDWAAKAVSRRDSSAGKVYS